MKETPLSSCEKSFLLEALAEGKRVDGRGLLDTRDLDITFGRDWGACQVTLGKTRVLAQVSASVTEPMLTRPNEGILRINVELTPLAAPRFESGRMSDECVEISRSMDRCLMESRCVDLESLCIVAEEKVWQIRLDIHVLNHEGNLFDACSVAGLAALSHFRRPDVTLHGTEVTIHELFDRDPVPLAIHHHPVTVTFGLFDCANSGADMTCICDPSRLEEETMMGKMLLGVNAYREICTLHLAGQILMNKSLVLRLANIAAEKSKKVVEQIKSALLKDEEKRKARAPLGFAVKNMENCILRQEAPKAQFNFAQVSLEARKSVRDHEPPTVSPEYEVKEANPEAKMDVGEVVPETVKEDLSESDDDDDVQMSDQASADEKKSSAKEAKTDLIGSDEDSEEEETVML